jgi:hypothetical protein
MANVKIGDGVTIAGSTSIHEVINVTSDTQLTVSPVYAGTTGSGKTFGVVPVQGYVKDLANQAKSLLLTFSTVGASVSVNALAGITGAANQIPYFTSGSTMWTTPLTAAARTLLDDADVPAMRTTLGLKAAALADIKGTVSQSGGVPTGAIIETGNNANGYYTKFADGTLICTNAAGVASPTIVANGSTQFNVNLPSAFVAGTISGWACGYPMGSWEYYGTLVVVGSGTSAMTVFMRNGPYPQQFFVYYNAIGRWY